MFAGTNAAEFTLGIEIEIEAVEEQRRDLTITVALYVLRQLLFGTRVDTGRARGNWQIAEGRPPTGTVEVFDRAGRLGDTDVVAARSTEIMRLSGDREIWFHNGLPYIGILEDLDGMLEGAYQSAVVYVGALR